ncbi:MarR family transcriptional regulator [Actinocorallia longicatena]|uniref:MarR family winged helix-turn-helix transcriptional regulator n=1 Tax=Actinocorallia longicatena TaxID=111803 RepID=A0ABP6QDA3_9ACTN
MNEPRIAFLLAMAHRAMTDRLHQWLAEEGREALRPAHGYTFRFLAEGGVVTSVELGQRLGVSKQAATKIAAELEEWGYVVRRPHPTDGRARALGLTQRGLDYISHVDGLWDEAEAEWAALIGPERLEETREAIAAYVEHASAKGAPLLRPVW